MKNELLKQETTEAVGLGKAEIVQKYEGIYNLAKQFCNSDLVPDVFRGNSANTMIAIGIADRIGADPLMVMQNLYIIHGKPAWSSQFLISCVNASGRFTPLRFTEVGKRGEDSYGIVAWAKDRSGEKLESPAVTIEIAKKEGWFTKNGSKWQSMPDLMLRYRQATLFSRLYQPDLLMGIKTQDEIVDIEPVVTEQRKSKFDKQTAEEPVSTLEDELKKRGSKFSAEDVKKFIESNGEIYDEQFVIGCLDGILKSMDAESGKGKK